MPVGWSRRALLGAAAALGACRGCRRPGPPNIVLVLTDDQGYNDLGCYASGEPEESRIRTPRLDALAAEGVRFTDFYVAAPTCSPSRAALLTGRYPPRCGFVEDTNLGPGDLHGLPPSELTIAEVLRDAGYATGCIGKWHLGTADGMMPRAQGFDTFYGIPWSANQKPLPLLRDDAVVRRLGDHPILVEEFTREAIAFVTAHREQRFFLYLAHSAPHVPLSIEPEYRGRSARGLYGDVVMRIDDCVGALLDALDAQGLRDDTLVLFTADNGPWLQRGVRAGDPTPFRGGKGSTLEGGVREPLIARWPGVIPAGSVASALCSALDFFPTFTALAGATLPAGLRLDGAPLQPIFQAPETATTAYDAFFYFAQGRLEAVRRDRFKLRLPVPERAQFDIHQALFDLAADPREEVDVSPAHPVVVADLRARADQMSRALGLPSAGGAAQSPAK